MTMPSKSVLTKSHNLSIERIWKLCSKYIRFFYRLYGKTLKNIFASLLLIAAISLGVITYTFFNQSDPTEADLKKLLLLIQADFAILSILILIIGRKVIKIWRNKNQGLVGSRLHARFVTIFGFLTAAPVTIIAFFSIFFFNSGIENWFSEKQKKALEYSVAVSDAYLLEQKNLIKSDAEAMAKELSSDLFFLLGDEKLLNSKLTELTEIRSLREAIVVDSDLNVKGRSYLTFALDFELMSQTLLPKFLVKPMIFISEECDKLRALIPLTPDCSYLLYIGRSIDPDILGHIKGSKNSVASYYKLIQGRQKIKVYFALIFMIAGLTLVGCAVWISLIFANRIMHPITLLIDAAEEVRAGNLQIQLPLNYDDQEISVLVRAFNKMVTQLDLKQQELMWMNQEIHEKQQLTESVLSGVTSGVISLDKKQRVEIFNKTACDLLNIKIQNFKGHKLSKILPEISKFIEDPTNFDNNNIFETKVVRKVNFHEQTLLFRILANKNNEEVHNYVINFVDITYLLAAQKQAAWSDVARRIAHEIKNPLTPIQLAAGRLKRKYVDVIENDSGVFKECIDTILRQVLSIGKLVDEFAKFAQLSQPKRNWVKAYELVKNSIILQKHAHVNIKFVEDIQVDEATQLFCDPQMISQCLTNLLVNSIQSIESKMSEDNSSYKGKVTVRLYSKNSSLFISVEDNGMGFPDNRDKLTEPYVTTKEKGTGLGLAIVKKIMEEHGGSISFDDAPKGGAITILKFPIQEFAKN